METQFPDTETIQTALTLAARAPSMYNTQPWRWRVGARRLHLYADPSRQLHSADPEGRDLILSCGATLHHAVVALAALGWRAKVHHFPDPTDADHLASIEVSTGDVDQVDVMLAAAIPRRRTDRRRYGPWPVPTADTALMAARAARCGVMLRQIDDLATLHAIVTQAIWEHATNYDYVNEATMWSGRYGSLAGVPPATPGVRLHGDHPEPAVRRPHPGPAARNVTRRRPRGDAGAGHRDRRPARLAPCG
ncbi:Putative NAD(P)H nitroreductase [Mycobacterium talmoniae]|uniref:NAD(P)H nitroreductase n=1 Tax=Mycobacterium talmoniae TaxID=1858794 RepID=A0A2S8BJP4_9MYCO|nr:Putative NAD(P)H nitroreductase [Mycobacterium talmoniae]